jgi:hypothetical protein
MASLAERLRDPTTREAAIRSMEDAPPGAPLDTAAVGVLSELRSLDAEEVPRELFERVSVLIGRLCLATVDDPAYPAFAAVMGEGRYALFLEVSWRAAECRR